nr:MAG TPA: hypothetical protein [Caudoviricetes sp.]
MAYLYHRDMLRKEAIIVHCNWIKQLHTWLVGHYLHR